MKPTLPPGILELLERVKNPGDVSRAGNLPHARRLVTIESYVGIRKIVHQSDAISLADSLWLFEECEIDALGRRVRRKVDDEHLWLRRHARDHVFGGARKSSVESVMSTLKTSAPAIARP